MRWGRWLLSGEYLTYCPDPGDSNPMYEINISELQSPECIQRWIIHLQAKYWVKPDDLAAFAQAGKFIVRAHITDERLWDEYELPVPQAMHWDEYRELLSKTWQRFLSETDPTDEGAFQTFFEDHPGLLPGPYGTTHRAYHGPLHGLIYTQPELPGIRAKRPDFLVLEQDSGNIYAVLIEIEAPSKRWATRGGVPSADLTQAIDQLRDWQAWFKEPENVIAFKELYGIDSQSLRSRTLLQHYILVYGRREEATRIKSFARKRHDLAGPDQFLMTYDRLEPNPASDLTVKLDRSSPDTGLRLVSVPPTFVLNMKQAFRFSMLSGREEAIRRNPFMSEARKEFLIERIPIADRYAERERHAAMIKHYY